MRTARATPSESIALATIEPSTQAATLSGCPSMCGGLVQYTLAVQPELQNLVGDNHTGRQRRRARSQPLPSGMSLAISSSIGGSRRPASAAIPKRGLPDEVVLTRGDLACVTASRANRQDRSGAEAALEVDV